MCSFLSFLKQASLFKCFHTGNPECMLVPDLQYWDELLMNQIYQENNLLWYLIESGEDNEISKFNLCAGVSL